MPADRSPATRPQLDMRVAEIIEIYLPAYRDVGWVRVRMRWGRISTFKLRRSVVEDMAHDVLAKPERRPVIDPKKARRDTTWAHKWPPAAQASTWLVQERVEERTSWKSLSPER